MANFPAKGNALSHSVLFGFMEENELYTRSKLLHQKFNVFEGTGDILTLLKLLTLFLKVYNDLVL